MTIRSNLPPRLRIGLALAVATAIVTGFAYVRFAQHGEQADSSIEPVTIATSPATRENGYRLTRYYSGRVEPKRSSKVGFELSGTVTSVAVDEGDRVVRGQLLGTLDTLTLGARKNELQAELNQAEARFNLARITFDRLTGLVAQGAASKQSVDDVREGLASIEAARRLAEARLESNRVQIEKSTLRAPYDAVVVHREVDEGRVVEAGQALLTLLEYAPPRARIGVAGKAAAGFEVGSSQTLLLGETPADGTVRAVLPLRSGRNRTVDVIFELHVEPLSARAGDLVAIAVVERVETTGYWLPVAALTETARGLWSVMATDPQGDTFHVSTRTLELIHIDGDRVFVQGTLRNGEHVVSSGVHKVVPGQEVRIAQPAEGQS